VKYLLVFFYFLGFNAPSEDYKLRLSIQNIQEVKGNIEVGIYNTSDSFLKEGQALKTYIIPVDGNTVTYEIDDLLSGNYAIAIYQDKNTDGKCNLNFIGIPKEPYGFSNNIKPKFSTPSFKDCEFSLNSNRTLEIKLVE